MRVGCGRSLSSPIISSLLLGDDSLYFFITGSSLVRADCDSGANSLNYFEESDVVFAGTTGNPVSITCGGGTFLFGSSLMI